MCHPCTCLHRINTYTLLLLLETVEDVRHMPLVTPSTGSVLLTLCYILDRFWLEAAFQGQIRSS